MLFLFKHDYIYASVWQGVAKKPLNWVFRANWNLLTGIYLKSTVCLITLFNFGHCIQLP